MVENEVEEYSSGLSLTSRPADLARYVLQKDLENSSPVAVKAREEVAKVQKEWALRGEQARMPGEQSQSG